MDLVERAENVDFMARRRAVSRQVVHHAIVIAVSRNLAVGKDVGSCFAVQHFGNPLAVRTIGGLTVVYGFEALCCCARAFQRVECVFRDKERVRVVERGPHQRIADICVVRYVIRVCKCCYRLPAR